MAAVEPMESPALSVFFGLEVTDFYFYFCVFFTFFFLCHIIILLSCFGLFLLCQ